MAMRIAELNIKNLLIFCKPVPVHNTVQLMVIISKLYELCLDFLFFFVIGIFVTIYVYETLTLTKRIILYQDADASVRNNHGACI